MMFEYTVKANYDYDECIISLVIKMPKHITTILDNILINCDLNKIKEESVEITCKKRGRAVVNHNSRTYAANVASIYTVKC